MINSRRHLRAVNLPGRHLRAAIARCASPADSRLPTADGLQPTVCSPRRGISLLEVLISMFVLLFGLMGVAAIFPVGNHYAGKGEQFDRGSALAGTAFADLKARGMLKPELWLYADNPDQNEASPLTATDPITNRNYRYPARGPLVLQHPYSSSPGAFNVTDPNTLPGYAFVIDATSTADGLDPSSTITAGLDYFPIVDATGTLNSDMPAPWKPSGSLPGLAGQRWPIRRVTLPVPDPAAPANTTAIIPLTKRVAETIFRLHDDVTNELPKESDRPGIQRWTAVDQNATPTPKDPSDDTLLARSYTGSYSWLATVVPTSTESLLALQPINSRFGSDLYEVSVAIFHKREALPPSAATERTITAQMLQGNELIIYDANIDNVDAAAEGIRPGQWIAVAGVHPTTGAFLMKWYRVLSLDDETQENQQIYDNTGNLTGNYPVRRAMLDGPDWPLPKLAGGGVRPDITPRAILLPGIISVATQMLPMESAQ